MESGNVLDSLINIDRNKLIEFASGSEGGNSAATEFPMINETMKGLDHRMSGETFNSSEKLPGSEVTSRKSECDGHGERRSGTEPPGNPDRESPTESGNVLDSLINIDRNKLTEFAIGSEGGNSATTEFPMINETTKGLDHRMAGETFNSGEKLRRREVTARKSECDGHGERRRATDPPGNPDRESPMESGNLLDSS
jgi:hypothetical protein